MLEQPNSRLSSMLMAISRVAGNAVIFVGCLVLVGWTFSVDLLKGVLPGLVTMKANTAVAFVLSGASLRLLLTEQARRRTDYVVYACGSLVAAIGLSTFVQYLSGWNLGIDELLFKETSLIKTSAPGRMAPSTAVCFMLMGSALILLRRNAPRGLLPAQTFSITAALIGLLATVGYAYGVEVLYGVASYTHMALHTAVMFFVLGIGAMCASPERGVFSILTTPYAGSTLARRQLPAVLAVPLLLGFLLLVGERSKNFSSPFSLSLFAVSTIIIFAGLTLMTSRLLNRVDYESRVTEVSLRERLQDRIAAEQEARKEAERLSSDRSKMLESLQTSLVAEKQAQAETQRLQQEIIRVQEATLAELSTPLIPISAQITVMPLIGAMDSRRSQRVLEVLLAGVSANGTQVAIIDITGVAVVDTQVADGLIRAAKAVRLLGAQVVLTGIRPEVARMIVALGVDLNGIVTSGSLQSGIEVAMAALKRRIG